jgi:hypothetical protein
MREWSPSLDRKAQTAERINPKRRNKSAQRNKGKGGLIQLK